MRIRSRWIALGTASLLALAACGGDKAATADQALTAPAGESDGETPAPSAEPTATPTASPTATPSSTPAPPDDAPSTSKPRPQAPAPTSSTDAFSTWPDARIVEITKGFDYEVGMPQNVPTYQRNVELSADGSHVAFLAINDFGEGDPNQVVVRAVDGGPFEFAATAADGTRGDRGADEFSLSADGRTIAFSSVATNLVPGGSGGHRHVYVKNLDTGSIVRVSTAPDGTPGDGDSSAPSLSADGRTVVFTSSAANLDADDANGKADVFLRSLEADEPTLVSQDGRGKPLAAGGSDGVVSGDGRTVVFLHGDGKSLQVRRLVAGKVVVVDSPVERDEPIRPEELTVSHNGNVFAFLSRLTLPGDTNANPDAFVADVPAGKFFRASLRPDGKQLKTGSDTAAISPDGTRLVFAEQFAYEDDNPMRGVWVRNLTDATTTRVSDLNPHGVAISTKNTRVVIVMGSKIYVVSK